MRVFLSAGASDLRACVQALPYLSSVCRLMEHEHWTARRTGVEALGSVAASWPTRERLAQAQERLRIVNAEIGASRQRCLFRPLNDTALVVLTFLYNLVVAYS